jgi:hypothetical protein
MTVEAIKDAIQQLPEEERTSLAAWLNEMEYDDWDQEMVRDFSPGGRGIKWVEQVNQEVTEGKSRPMEQGFRQRRGKPS